MSSNSQLTSTIHPPHTHRPLCIAVNRVHQKVTQIFVF